MDPLSVLSGVAGLLSVSAAVIKMLDTIKTNMENCPRTVMWAHAEAREINWAIERLKGLIDDPDSTSKAARMSVGIHDATVTISELVTTCDGLVHTLKPFDTDPSQSLSKWDKLKWIRVQDDVVKYIRQLQVHKVSVTLILNILQCESAVFIEESQNALGLKIEAVLASSEATQKRIEGLEALFNKFIADNSTLYPSTRLSMDPNLIRWKEEEEESSSEASSVLTLPKDHDSDEWSVSHTSARRSLSFPTPDTSVPELSVPKLKRGSIGERPAKPRARITPAPRRGFEAALEETRVYRRVYNSTDNFSIYSAPNRSMVGSVMTSFSLADDSSILSAFPIMSRTELQHPEYYAHMGGNEGISRGLMRAITTRSVVKSPIEPSVQAPFSLKQFRSPPNCGESVMGRWHQSRTTIWLPKEFRTEVQFEVPVIFISRPGATKGPVPEAQVYSIDGTRKSLDDTWTDLEPPPASTTAKSGRVVKNERATWLTLLSSLQKMENESQNWTRQQIMGLRPRPASASAILTSIAGKHSLGIALQREKKSWDDMPASINRPYATTTMSHLVEMLAMLGIYWRDFNSTYHMYQAEGNGFIVKGHKISGFGIMFYFQALEKPVFQANRPIPTQAITRLAFGQLPMIFSPDFPRDPFDEQLHDSPIVRVGSRTDIADTLASFGCDRKSANYFLRDGAVTSHIFPIIFELIGMVGQIFHIKDLCFRYIPNPCYCVWSARDFSLPKLLAAYLKYIQEDPDMARRQLPIPVQTLLSPKTSIHPQDGTHLDYSWQTQDLLHSVIEDLDDVLKPYFTTRSDTPLSHLGQDILGVHFQEVLSQMNSKPSPSSTMVAFPRFEGLNTGDKEDLLMETYFQQILPAVLRSVSTTFFSLKTSDSEFRVVKGEAAQAAEYAAYVLASKEVWCTLVLRMICWLILHDFHPDDIQITKGGVLGSRLPVYVS
ncbi:modin [Fusarium heterosporum]|uniref:Modin n=1 Tax=Fusarium heterosporum TaxID=42747 RepID=A0A8H5X3I6_FUSHE|nr:modin [Fusarium heterosporum]